MSANMRGFLVMIFFNIIVAFLLSAAVVHFGGNGRPYFLGWMGAVVLNGGIDLWLGYVWAKKIEEKKAELSKVISSMEVLDVSVVPVEALREATREGRTLQEVLEPYRVPRPDSEPPETRTDS